MESLQGWFVKQGIGNLCPDDVSEREEVLLLLASEKQWDDIREICQNELNIPKIKIAYLKAYLIKRTKTYTNDVENNKNETIKTENKTNKKNRNKRKNEKNDNDKSLTNKYNKNKRNNKTIHKQNANNELKYQETNIKTMENVELLQIPQIPQITQITQQGYKTNYMNNGLKYKNIQMICDDYQKYFNNNKPFILRGSHLFDNITSIWSPQYLANKLPNNLFHVKLSNSRDFREINMDKNYGRHKLIQQQHKNMQVSMYTFINNVVDTRNNNLVTNYYLQTTLNELDNLDLNKWNKWNVFMSKLNKWNKFSNRLCISSKGCMIPLQYKQTNNFLISLNGYVEILLFDPITTQYLYPFPFGHPYHRQSMLNCEYLQNNNTNMFKKFNTTNNVLNNNIYRCVLSPNDILYIPNYWWHEITNLNDFNMNIMFENKPPPLSPPSGCNINQIFNNKTIEQKIAIARNIERIVFIKYGSNQNITTQIFKSFLNIDEKYTKHRNDIRKLLKNVFHENEIDTFVSELVNGRYNNAIIQ